MVEQDDCSFGWELQAIGRHCQSSNQNDSALRHASTSMQPHRSRQRSDAVGGCGDSNLLLLRNP